MGETVQKDLDKANSAWHELAVMFGGPRRRTMICRTLRYRVGHSHPVLLLKKHCLNQHSHTPWRPLLNERIRTPGGQTVP